MCVCGRDRRIHLLDIGNRNSRRATETQEQALFSLPCNIGSLGWGIMDKDKLNWGWVLRYLDGDQDMIDSVRGNSVTAIVVPKFLKGAILE